MKQTFWAVVAATALGLTAGRADAAAVIDILQVGSNVVATGSGTLDLTALTFQNTVTTGNSVIPSSAFVGVGPMVTSFDVYSGVSGPSSFGSGGVTPSSSGTGDSFAIEGVTGSLGVPVGYVSGASLLGTMTIDSTTFSGLGMTPGTYTFTLPHDTLTVIIGAAVPEPSSLLLAGTAALAGLGARVKRRRG